MVWKVCEEEESEIKSFSEFLKSQTESKQTTRGPKIIINYVVPPI